MNWIIATGAIAVCSMGGLIAFVYFVEKHILFPLTEEQKQRKAEADKRLSDYVDWCNSEMEEGRVPNLRDFYRSGDN